MNGEKVALDFKELLKIDPGYYMIKCCRSVNMRRKRSSIYRMSKQQQKNVGWCCVIPNKNKKKEKQNH